MSGLRVPVAAATAVVLAAVALAPLYAGVPWFLPAVATVIAVVAATESARRLGAPRALVPVVGLIVLLVAVTLGFARSVAIAWALPGPAALAALRSLVAAGLADAQRLAAPVPATPGLTLLPVAGVGLVALAVDTIAVTLRRPALAGLPLLALYALPVGIIPGGTGLLPFALAAAGFLALLVADGRARLARWGSPVRAGRRGTPPEALGPAAEGTAAAPLLASGHRLGAVAIAAALLVPAMLPGLDDPWVPRGTGIGEGGGPSSIMVVNPIVDLKRDLTVPRAAEVLRFRSTDPSPDYLRMVTLDTFDGTTWQQSPIRAPRSQRVAAGMPAPPGLAPQVPVREVSTRIRVTRLDVPWLPMPYPATRVTIDGDWRYDAASGVVFSTRARSGGAVYDVASRRLAPTGGQLDTAPSAAGLERYRELPDDLPQVIRELAVQVAGDARSPYQQAVALQQWFRKKFAYDLAVVPGNGNNALLAFLEDRRGYCEQFAATMAVMARALGIPARVAVGFTPGTRGADGWWSVTSRDAHAWPELYLSGVGWIRFEPTPLGDGRARVPAYSLPVYVPRDDPRDRPDASARPPAAGDARAAREPSEARPGTPPAARDDSWVVAALAAGAGVPVLLLAPMLAARLRERRRWRRTAGDDTAAAHAAWAQLHDAVIDLGWPWRRADSPRGTAARLVATVPLEPSQAAALARVTRAEERARYSSRPSSGRGLREDVEGVTAALFAAASWRRRARARLAPASVRRALVSRAGALVARFERAWAARGGEARSAPGTHASSQAR